MLLEDHHTITAIHFNIILYTTQDKIFIHFTKNYTAKNIYNFISNNIYSGIQDKKSKRQESRHEKF